MANNYQLAFSMVDDYFFVLYIGDTKKNKRLILIHNQNLTSQKVQVQGHFFLYLALHFGTYLQGYIYTTLATNTKPIYKY